MHIVFKSLATFSWFNHILDPKTCLKKFKKNEIIPCIFSDRKGMKLEINTGRNSEKPQKCGD